MICYFKFIVRFEALYHLAVKYIQAILSNLNIYVHMEARETITNKIKYENLHMNQRKEITICMHDSHSFMKVKHAGV